MDWIHWAKITYLILLGGYLFACILAIDVNNNLKSKGYTGIPLKECFFPSKHFSFLVGYTVSLIPWWIMDQYAMRFYDPECRICILKKSCERDGVKGCGCDPRKKACSPFEKCSFDNYGPIIFNKQKAINHLSNIKYKIEVKYGTNS